MRQMYSATLRAYANGPDTTGPRRRIVLEYLNTVPFAAAPGIRRSDRARRRAVGVVTAPTSTRSTRSCRNPPRSGRALKEQGHGLPPGAEPADRPAAPDLFPRPRTRAARRAHRQLPATRRERGTSSRPSCATPRSRRSSRSARTAPADRAPSCARGKARPSSRNRLAAMLETPRLYDVDRLDVKVAQHARRRDAGRGHRAC